ncbi:MAG TPA: hypothetical protein VH986_14190 [Acidimicrobiia bacterium]
MNARGTRLRRLAQCTVTIVVVSASALLVAGPGNAASTDVVVVKPPKGAAKPVPGTGIGTKAAMQDPRCRTGAQYGVYGKWDSSSIGGGPICVRPFKAGESNGGATSPGVTAKSIKVVAVLPTPARSQSQALAAQLNNLATGSKGTWEDAIHDYLVANLPYYETWGRDIDVSFYTSTGTDETAQRADAVAILAMKPFAVVNFDSYGLDTLLASLSQAKVVTEAFSVSQQESERQAPYRWGGNDANAAATASAEVLGKNLVGKKAQYAGKDLQGTTRKFGLVLIKDVIDENNFKQILGKYKGTIANTQTYVASGGAIGDPTISQEQAPTMVTKMKDAGVTTVVLFTDVAMNTALMQQATAQNWFPEWFMTGAGYFDLPVLAVAYPKEQAEHAFGITLIPPYFDLPDSVTAITGVTGAFNWYFGQNLGTTSGAVPGGLSWLLNGIHDAGPDLTPKTFQQGLFAAPATPNPTDSPLVTLSGYGHTTGLPYEAYSPGPADFTVMWMDPHTRSISAGSGTEVDTSNWFPNGAKRYKIGTWPKNIVWFDKSDSIDIIDKLPAGVTLPTAAPPCPQGACPSTGGSQASAGTPSSSGFVAKAWSATGATS